MWTCNQRILAPSLLASDWAHLASEVNRAEEAGADWLHLDVMDGHFVENISFGPQFVQTVRRQTGLFLDVHLMIHRPDHYVDKFLEAGADNITIHVEADYETSLPQTLARIHAAGRKAGLAINPATPWDAVLPYADQIDLLLVMTVVPGFGGQKFMTETMAKLESAREYRSSHNLAYHLEVDGGIYADTALVAASHGANVLVAGTYAFGTQDMRSALEAIR